MGNSEDMARALNTQSAMSVTIAGIECHPRALSIQELSEVERECLAEFKRSYLETYHKNLDLLPEESRPGLMGAKLDEVALWDISNLPTKFAHDPTRVTLSAELRNWLKEKHKLTGKLKEKIADDRLLRVVAGMLDQGMLSAEEYTKLTAEESPKVRVPYINWWITGAFSGMISFVHTCFKHHGVSREQVIDATRSDPTVLIELAQEIERLSTPKLGNS